MKSIPLVPYVIGVCMVLLAVNGGLVYAAELKGTTGGSLNALNTGYAITRWPWNGGDLLPNQDATVRACTTQPPYPETTQVVFRWHRPDGTSFDVGPVDLKLSADTWDGKPIYDAFDTQTLNMAGNWGVQALFLDEGKLQGPNPYPIVQIKAISWHVIPEVPLGTISITLSMLGALAFFAIRKKAFLPKR